MNEDVQVDGGAVADTSVASTTPPNSATTDTAPNPIDVTPDTLIRVDGKPVKFGDHFRGFQSQATRAAQEAATLRRQLQERESALQRYQDQERNAQRQAGQQAPNEALARLANEPYISGKDAVEIVQSVAASFQQRDQVLLGALKQIQILSQTVNGLHQGSVTQGFDSKISKWLTEGGYSEEYTDLAKELYLAYEPSEELDYEFPAILKARVDQVEAAIETKRRKAAEQARNRPFVPGRGSQVGPSKPLQLDPRKNPQEIADELWNSIQVTGT